MNVFYIPSWYPSHANPIYGTFVKEQIQLLAQLNPDWRLGVSLWGQGDPAHMLWVKDHFKNARKIIHHLSFQTYTDQQSNIYTYHSPTLTWTRKVLYGNLKGLIRSNEQSFKRFEQAVSKVDVIHAQATYPAALIAQALSEKYKIPYVVSIRMSPFPFPEFLQSKGGLKSFISVPLSAANNLIATSHSLEKTLVDFGLDKVQVIHNPVDTTFFQPLDFTPESLTLLTVGRMEHQKGIDLLIRAIATLGNEFKGKIRIGGAGAHLLEYQKLSVDLVEAEKFEWLGELSREAVRDEMQRCSFYVLPSRHETFGNVLLEAMACGKPILATDCGGPADIVTSEVGMLCENENVEALTNGIRDMMSNYNSYNQTAIRQHVIDKFSPESFSKQMSAFYSIVVAR